MTAAKPGRARLGFALLVFWTAPILSGCAVWDAFAALFHGGRDRAPVEQPCAAQKMTPETAAGMEPYDAGILLARNLPYATYANVDPNLTSLDVYAPDSGGCHPILVFIHGGGWIGGDKRFVDEKPRAFVRAGYVFASVNYRLSPKVSHPAHVQDVAQAIRKIRDLAPRYGGDPSRIYLVGHSAGAHLAALVATDGRYLEAQGLSLAAIRGRGPAGWSRIRSGFPDEVYRRETARPHVPIGFHQQSPTSGARPRPSPTWPRARTSRRS